MKHFLKSEQIPINSKWTSTDGAGIEVTVTNTDPEGEGWVTYQWEERGKTVVHEKSAFSFQVRYEPMECPLDSVLARLHTMCIDPNNDGFWLHQAILQIKKLKSVEDCIYA